MKSQKQKKPTATDLLFDHDLLDAINAQFTQDLLYFERSGLLDFDHDLLDAINAQFTQDLLDFERSFCNGKAPLPRT